MADRISPERRSAVMARVRGKDTSPEMFVRRLLHAAGYRFRLHDSKLPGRPDMVLKRFHAVIFVHGCYWHRHPRCPRASMPGTRVAFWKAKFAKTVKRDRQNVGKLKKLGWRVITVWECQLANNPEAAFYRILAELGGVP